MTLSLVLLACVALFLFAPHHRRRGELFRPCTLAEIYLDLFRDLPPVITPARAFFVSLAVAGLATCMSPPILVLLIRVLPPLQHRAGGAVFVFAGLIGLAGAAANFVAMLASHMTIGFGVSDSSSKDQTMFLVLIPLLQIAVALASLAMGVSASCASLAQGLVVSGY